LNIFSWGTLDLGWDAFAIVLSSSVMMLFGLGKRELRGLGVCNPQASGEIHLLVLNFAEMGQSKSCGTLKKYDLHCCLMLYFVFGNVDCNTFSSLQDCSCIAKVNHCKEVC